MILDIIAVWMIVVAGLALVANLIKVERGKLTVGQFVAGVVLGAAPLTALCLHVLGVF